MTPAVFDASGLRYRYPAAARDAVAGVDLRVDAGEFVALLGPNGSGKSTLLRLLLGALPQSAGSLRVEGRPIADWPRDELARRVGVVTQSEELPFPLTVRELVSMGRYPHLGAWRRESAHDRRAIQRAMDWCEVSGFAERPVLSLSGGERQRARLARALAQEAPTLVLDEPTAALDMAHEMALFEMMACLAIDGVTIVAITHNLNVAARYAHRLVLLSRGAAVADGPPASVLTRETIEQVYHWPVTIRSEDSAPQVVPLRRAFSPEQNVPQPGHEY
jgi:iron complex transport system ATP-binding protein